MWCILICRHSTYLPLPDNKQYLVPSVIHLPLGLEPLQQLISTAKDLLSNNFNSCFATIAGSVLLFHYQVIMEEQDECPLVLCYSRGNGTGTYSNLFEPIIKICFPSTGKTTALRVALSVYGVVEENGNSHKTSAASISVQAALTTLPLGLCEAFSLPHYTGTHSLIFSCL